MFFFGVTVTAFIVVHNSLFIYAEKWIYGRHFPYGTAAAEFMYSAEYGTFTPLTDVVYEYNYYEQYATAEHPYNRDALIAQANDSTLTTCRDANGHLLLDSNHDTALDCCTDS